MCRLFGLSSTPLRACATFWLLEAPDSLTEQSRREPDGTGLGHYVTDGQPLVYKAPIAAYEDRCFAAEAKHTESTTFIAHVRYASTGGLAKRNTHPFEQDGRLFAHNGVVEGLDLLEAHLGPDMSLVHGETDSERVFALITREIRANGGDIEAGLSSALRWVAAELPLYALNIILITADGLWALRYPDTHELHVLAREPGGDELNHCGSDGRIHVRCTDLATKAALVVASEPMDDDPSWQLMNPGELLHAGPNCSMTTRLILPDPPAHRLTLADLHPEAAASQRANP
ncbi:class II glutamine amidotransferase [Acrocarpospora phusangensis]|uniref:Class II glutamine amidotransferase n=1 Tax=Acrocarpospora phusangensis TaxID=1070424 RepID=A0A919UI24_9ACTN|nr:class II glutamine amidotransferase [Acrocarpospora phusangensis]GIH22201.1 class II glutamine amidotransferase [Acrocarpospora phusangensis]